MSRFISQPPANHAPPATPAATANEVVLSFLRARPEGAASDQFGDLELQFFAIRKALQRLSLDGLAKWVPEPLGSAYQRRRYYAAEHAPAHSVFGKQPKGKAIVLKPLKSRMALRLSPDAPVVGKIPKPIKCPGGRDTRLEVDPRNVTPLFSALGYGRYLATDTAVQRAYSEDSQ